MKLNPGHKIILTVSLLCLLVIFIIGAIIYPVVASIQKTTKQTYDLRLYMEKRYQNSLRSRLTKKKIETMKEDTKNYDLYLFRKADSLALIQNLEQTADDSNVNQTITGSNLDSIAAGKKLNINLTVSGIYSDVIRYINALEISQYFLNIKSVRLIPSHDSHGNINDFVTGYLNIELYVAK